MKEIGIKESLKNLSLLKSDKIKIDKIISILQKNAALILVIIFAAPTALPTPALPVLTQILSSAVILILLQLIFS